MESHSIVAWAAEYHHGTDGRVASDDSLNFHLAPSSTDTQISVFPGKLVIRRLVKSHSAKQRLQDPPESFCFRPPPMIGLCRVADWRWATGIIKRVYLFGRVILWEEASFMRRRQIQTLVPLTWAQFNWLQTIDTLRPHSNAITRTILGHRCQLILELLKWKIHQHHQLLWQLA